MRYRVNGYKIVQFQIVLHGIKNHKWHIGISTFELEELSPTILGVAWHEKQLRQVLILMNKSIVISDNGD